MKNEIIIKINTIEKVKRFCEICNKFTEDIDLNGGRYIVNAKSIMGIFALDLSNDLAVTIHSSNAETLEKFADSMAEFKA